MAGQQRGFRGERSSLWFEFHRVLSELRPQWCLIENVPGLLSSGAEPGADFGVVLRGLVDLGYGVAWRTLDARWFESPSGAAVSSLSAVLETRPVPRRYWLSARAAAGILRRAEKRRKTLPPRLMTALEGLASSSR